MRTVQAATQHMRLSLVPACLAAIILGILGMHAFAHQEPVPLPGTSHHGVGSVDVGAPRDDMASMSVGTIGISESMASALGSSDGMTDAGAAATEMPAHSLEDMVMLCAAMLLAAAGSALLALRLRRLATTTVTRLKPMVQTPTTAATGRRVGTGPPPVWEFSVIRC